MARCFHNLALLFLLIALPVSGVGNCWTALTELYDRVTDSEYLAMEPRLRDGKFLPRVVRTRSFYSAGYVSQLVTVETRPELAIPSLRAAIEKQAVEGEARFRKELVPWVQFAIDQYGRRSWTDGFKKQLFAFAQDYAHRSTYLIVRERVGDEGVGKIVGTMRLISASYYGVKHPATGEVIILDRGVPLPEEVYLQTLLPRQWHDLDGKGLVGGEILEPGNFAVLRGVSEAVEREIFAHFLNLLNTPSHNGIILPNHRNLFTYGDRTSVRLYGGKGFHPCKGLGILHKDETDWTCLEATPHDILTRYQEVVAGEKGATTFWKELKASLDYFLNTELRRQ